MFVETRYELIFTDLVSLKIEDKLDANFSDMTWPYDAWHDNMVLTSYWIRAFSNAVSDIQRYGPYYLDENNSIIEIEDIGFLICTETRTENNITVTVVNISFRNGGRLKSLFESRSLLSYVIDLL